MDTQFLYDTNQTLKNAIQDLLKHGYIEKHQKPNIYQQLFGNIDFINAYLSIMDLSMHINDIRGVIYVGVYQKFMISLLMIRQIMKLMMKITMMTIQPIIVIAQYHLMIKCGRTLLFAVKD